MIDYNRVELALYHANQNRTYCQEQLSRINLKETLMIQKIKHYIIYFITVTIILQVCIAFFTKTNRGEVYGFASLLYWTLIAIQIVFTILFLIGVYRNFSTYLLNTSYGIRHRKPFHKNNLSLLDEKNYYLKRKEELNLLIHNLEVLKKKISVSPNAAFSFQEKDLLVQAEAPVKNLRQNAAKILYRV